MELNYQMQSFELSYITKDIYTHFSDFNPHVCHNNARALRSVTTYFSPRFCHEYFEHAERAKNGKCSERREKFHN